MESISRLEEQSGVSADKRQEREAGGSLFPGPWRRRAAIAWLAVRVHLDALRFKPIDYARALAWRARGLRIRSRNRIAPLAGRSPHAYDLWIARHEPASRALSEGIRSEVDILPVVDCRSGSGVEQTLASLEQTGGTGQPILIGGQAMTGHLRVDRPGELQRILPNGTAWICPLQAGDRLAPGALRAYARAIEGAADSVLLYADDDLLDPNGRRGDPHFKPDWNPELFRHHDFLTGACVVRVQAATVAQLPDAGWAEWLVADAVRCDPAPIHLPLMLHHRASRPQPVVPAQASEPLANPPTLSAIIPTRNHGALLRTCVEGLQQANYPDVELLLVDNGSDEPETLELLRQIEASGGKVLRRPGPFNFSKLNNEAVRHASGRMLCFLNNDVEMINGGWLPQMVRQAMRPEVGAVGAMLLYPDHSIQHAGVTLGIGGGAGHAHRYLSHGEQGYFDRARLPQFVSAVTAACMVVAREKFVAVGGFEEELFPVAFNDVDLCLKLNSRGWQSFYEPRARLIHHESKSRGCDSLKPNRSRFAGELAALKAKWHTDHHRDPFHHPELSPFSEQFVIAI